MQMFCIYYKKNKLGSLPMKYNDYESLIKQVIDSYSIKSYNFIKFTFKSIPSITFYNSNKIITWKIIDTNIELKIDTYDYNIKITEEELNNCLQNNKLIFIQIDSPI